MKSAERWPGGNRCPHCASWRDAHEFVAFVAGVAFGLVPCLVVWGMPWLR